MSIVSVAWVPEGIAVSADTRAISAIDGGIVNDYSMKILPFEQYKFFITLCGDSYFGNKKFEDFMLEIVDDYFRGRDDLANFILELLGEIINTKQCKESIYEIIVAGYNKNNGKEIIATIRKGEGNRFLDEDSWFLSELNGYSETDAQMNLIDEIDFEGNPHLYGVYVAGIDIDNIRQIHKFDIYNYEQRRLMHEYFLDKSLVEAKNICNEIVEKTMYKLNNDEDIPSVGGATVSYYIRR